MPEGDANDVEPGGPPAGVIGGWVPWRITLIRTERLFVVLQAFEAFPAGVLFDLVSRFPARDPTPEHWGRIVGDRNGLQLGVRFSDGRTATVDYAPDDPTRPRLRPRGGSLGRAENRSGLWLRPPPPAGPLTWTTSWREMGVPETEVAVDATELLMAAANAEVLGERRPQVRQVDALPANRPVNERLICEVQEGQRPPTQPK